MKCIHSFKLGKLSECKNKQGDSSPNSHITHRQTTTLIISLNCDARGGDSPKEIKGDLSHKNKLDGKIDPGRSNDI